MLPLDIRSDPSYNVENTIINRRHFLLFYFLVRMINLYIISLKIIQDIKKMGSRFTGQIVLIVLSQKYFVKIDLENQSFQNYKRFMLTQVFYVLPLITRGEYTNEYLTMLFYYCIVYNKYSILHPFLHTLDIFVLQNCKLFQRLLVLFKFQFSYILDSLMKFFYIIYW